MKRCYINVLVGMLCLWILAGCGIGTTDSSVVGNVGTITEENVGEEAGPVQPTEAPKEPYDLMTQEWEPAGELTNAGNWWKVTDYIDNIIQPQEGMESFLRYSVADGSDFYVLVSYDRNAGADVSEIDTIEHYVNHLNTETMDTECFKLPEHELLTAGAFPVGLAAANGRLMVFVQDTGTEEQRITLYYGLELNTDGTWGEAVDLLPALEEGGVLPEKNQIFSKGQWDSQGYFYFTNEESTNLCVMDATGNLLEVLEGESGQQFVSKCKSPAGILIWEKEDREADRITYFCYSEAGEQRLYQGPYEFVSERSMNSYGELIYVYKSALVRWNAATGACERLYAGTDMEAKRYSQILQNSQGKIVIVEDEGDRFTATSYSSGGPAKMVTLTLQTTGVYDYATRSYVEEFARRHPGVTIEVRETDFDNREAQWTQLIAQLAAGKGPDLLLLNREEMLILQEKGVLADLSEVLPQELEEQIFQGVLDNGRVDGKLYGMTYSARYTTLMVSKELWRESTWTIEDVLQIIKEKEVAGTPIEAFSNVWWQSGGQTGEQIFFNLIYDLENSPFLDLAKGECYFNTEQFCELLEICKKYDSANVKSLSIIDTRNGGEQRKYVRNGQALAYKGFESTLSAFSEDMAAFDNEYFCVGYPTEGESGSYWECGYMLTVNAQAEEREIIEELLAFLYSEDCQMDALANSGIIVRRDLLVDSVVGYVDWSDTPKQKLGPYSWADLEPKPDGSTYLEEYLELLDHCVAAPTGPEEIEAILSEEIPAFFHGDKDAEAVAEIVQRRVQLYLDERK